MFDRKWRLRSEALQQQVSQLEQEKRAMQQELDALRSLQQSSQQELDEHNSLSRYQNQLHGKLALFDKPLHSHTLSSRNLQQPDHQSQH